MSIAEPAEVKAPPQIHKAIIAIMREVGAVGKDSKNDSQGYMFRGIDAVYNRVHPLFAKHGVYSVTEVVDSQVTQTVEDKMYNGKKTGERTICRAVLHMRFTFFAEDGSSVTSEAVGEGLDYGGDKASAKAMSIGDKYGILQLLKIPTAMVDSDAVTPREPPPAVPAPRVQTRAQRVTSQEITDCAKIWKDLRGKRGEDATIEAWTAWVGTVTGRKFNVRRADEWRVDDMAKVQAARSEMEGTEK